MKRFTWLAFWLVSAGSVHAQSTPSAAPPPSATPPTAAAPPSAPASVAPVAPVNTVPIASPAAAPLPAAPPTPAAPQAAALSGSAAGSSNTTLGTSAATVPAASVKPAQPQHRPPPEVGITPGTPQHSGILVGPDPGSEATGKPSDDDTWKFDFKGYLRAPFRLGFGSSADVAPGVEKGGKLHAPPYVPDGVFTDWRYTNSLSSPWVELRFLYGTKRVTGNVSIAAYNITDGGYRNLQSQLGINTAFVSVDESDLFGNKGGLIWNVGVFQNAYGAAGRYDAGKYDTYLFGRTHIAGETLTAFWHFDDQFTVTLEHGVGGKLEAAPLVSGLPTPNPQFLPYPGPVQQGTQLVHHAHVMLSIGPHLRFGAHYLTTWTDDARLMNEVDGRITTTGLDVKLSDSRYGDGYLGFSHLSSRSPLRVGDGLEILHSIAGWNLRDNFFGQMSTASGTIDSVLFQYTLSLARLLRYPEPFWGQGPDIVLGVFGMYNHVSSKDPMFEGAKDKFKWGADATYTPLDFLGISVRFDRVQPDLQDKAIAFNALSPRLIFRSQFVTHEQLVLQYTHYFYGSEAHPAWPVQSLTPDPDAIMIQAIMWW